ncbi:MAG: 6-bladed beta-propeller [Bacteroidetes bacterium]|nr:6-bladed beta-propeller [Bacteroidota bacterium]
MKKISVSACILLIVVIASIFQSCGEKHAKQTNPITTYHITDYINQDTLLYLNDFASDIKYIKLETNDSCYLGGIVQLDFCADNLFILDDQLIISRFDDQGHYLNSIGHIGSGPGEFKKPYSFALLPKEQLIVVYDIAQLKSIVYSFDGKYQNEFRVSSFPIRIAALGDSLIAAVIPFPEIASNDFCAISIYSISGDSVGSVINRKSELQSRDYDRNTPIEGRIQLQQKPNGLFFWEMGLDTMYAISNEGKVFYNYIVSNSRSESVTASKGIGDEGIWYGRIIDSKRYIFVSPCIVNSKIRHLVIDKHTGRGYNYMVYNDMSQSMQLKIGLENNIDGGWPINPVKATSEGKFYTTFFGHELKALLNTGFFSKQVVNNTSKRNELDSLLSVSGVLDNPIIMIITEK